MEMPVLADAATENRIEYKVHILSRLYRVAIFDYGVSRGDWLLVSSGSGIMMAVMDAEPRFRWCVDLDGLPSSANIREWLSGLSQVVGKIAVVGGWWGADQEIFVSDLQAIPGDKVPVYITVADGHPFPLPSRFENHSSMKSFLKAL
jgi:hypothetical protein